MTPEVTVKRLPQRLTQPTSLTPEFWERFAVPFVLAVGLTCVVRRPSTVSPSGCRAVGPQHAATGAASAGSEGPPHVGALVT